MSPIPRRSLGLAGAVAALAALLPGAARAQAGDAGAKKNKVVFQISDNDPAKWGLALNNARNAQAELGKNAVDIEIVAYGPGIAMLEGASPVAPRVATALESGVKVVACENTMKAQKLVPADMLAGIGYVPSGVVELMLKQQQGYAYIRP